MAGLRSGVRSRKELSEFVAGVCGHGLLPFLTGEEEKMGWGRPEREARASISAMAYEAIDMALRGPDAIIVR